MSSQTPDVNYFSINLQNAILPHGIGKALLSSFSLMLRSLLRDSEAVKVLFEKYGLFKTPEMLEKYVIASEATVEVLDVFLAHVFGKERVSIGGSTGVDLKALLDGMGCVSSSDGKDAAGQDSSARSGEPDKDVLCAKVQDLERQLCAVQQQLQMQGEVSQLAATLDNRLEEISRDCESRFSYVSSQVSAVPGRVSRLNTEMSEKASTDDMMELFEDVSHLKEREWSHECRLMRVEGTIESLRDGIKDLT